MSRERIKELKGDYRRALKRLTAALKKDPSKNDVIVDGVIQRFEFTFELAWKLAKVILAYIGVEANAPRPIIKEGFKAGLFEDGDGWIDMLEDRNKTSHIDEAEARKIYQKINKSHIKFLNSFNEKIEEY